MDFSLQDKVTPRQAILDREKAVYSARNPAVSKYGATLMHLGLKKNRDLSKQLDIIDGQVKRIETEMRQKKKYFVKNCKVLNYDPVMLVERPTSLETDINKHAYTSKSQNTKGQRENPPHYKSQLDSRVRPASYLTTTDAITIKSKKKKNIWEEGHDDVETRKFRSMVRPHIQLTKREQINLQKEWSFHKPRLTPDQIIYSSYVRSAKSRTPVKKIKTIDFLTSYKHFTVERVGNNMTDNLPAHNMDERSGVKHISYGKYSEYKNVRFIKPRTP